MVWDYRPEQIAPVALVVALPQLIVLPLVAAFCNFPRIDCRYVLAAGLLLMGLSFFAGTFITSDWYGATFYPLQALMVFGEPMVIIPILMCTTLSITPAEAPFVSGMFNMVKGLASALAVGFIDIMMTWREHLHSQVLLDQYGNSGFTLDSFHFDYGGLGGFGAAVRAQAMVLTSADIYAVMLPVIGGLLLLTILIPKRVLPPSALAKVGNAGTLTQVLKMITKKRVFIAGGIAVWVILAVIADRAFAGSGNSVETDDAYVTAHYSVIAPKVSGLIDRVDVNDNQYVLAGQELAHIDDRDYRTAVASAAAALAGAKAELAILQAQVTQQMATIAQAEATVQADDAALSFAQANAVRYRNLAVGGAGTVEQRSKQPRHCSRPSPPRRATLPRPVPPSGRSRCSRRSRTAPGRMWMMPRPPCIRPS